MKIVQLDAAARVSTVALFERVVARMRETGLDQWDELYPDRAVLEADLRSGCAFGIQANGDAASGETALMAYVVLNGEQSEEYRAIPWRDADGCPLVIHRLCVDPLFRGRGAAKRLAAFAEDYARERQFTSIRLDAFSINPAALSLYESLGYGRLGEVQFRKGRFYCYEKILRGRAQ